MIIVKAANSIKNVLMPKCQLLMPTGRQGSEYSLWTLQKGVECHFLSPLGGAMAMTLYWHEYVCRTGL